MQTLISSKSFIICLLFVINVSLFADSPDPVRAKSGMVVTASSYASQVGADILKKGGNAVDASVAVGFALAVTFPAAGNLGGGGFMVIHTKDGKDISIDYREMAPLSAHRDMYLDSLGNVIPNASSDDVTSSGVPGSVAGLIYALEKYGTMKLKDVINPAIKLAEKGFKLPYREARSIEYNLVDFNKYPSSKKVFSKNGQPYQEDELFIQKDLAKTLKLIRDKGLKGFYEGTTADLIVKQVKSGNGYITLEDLKTYRVIERAPVKGTFKGYDIISMAPPSSGGVALIELLNIVENFNFSKEDWNSSKYIHTIAEAMKYTYADRSVHLGDPDFFSVPVDRLTSKDYAKQLALLITDKAIPSKNIKLDDIELSESMETTHYSIVDKEGNAVSTTTTINSSFGSKVVVEGAGFLLNNEMDDFSIKPGVPNQFGLIGNKANAIAPKKRMLSSMTPTIVLKDNQPVMVIGTPGGSTIITAVFQAIMNNLVFGMDISESVGAPKIHHQLFPDEILYEEYGLTKDVKDALISKGQILNGPQSLGRLEGIWIDRTKNIIYGATDPRGYGSAIGVN